MEARTQYTTAREKVFQSRRDRWKHDFSRNIGWSSFIVSTFRCMISRTWHTTFPILSHRCQCSDKASTKSSFHSKKYLVATLSYRNLLCDIG